MAYYCTMVFIKLIGEKDEEMAVLPSEPDPSCGAARILYTMVVSRCTTY
jgi:hypothetical protein